ncbi:MAG TPA: sialate O-acetylesterase [Luteolibacter sp.]
MKSHSIAFVLVLAGASSLNAAITPHALFSDGAVLQQEREIPVWGTAKEGESIRVEFAGQTVSTTAKDGKWSIRLKPVKAGGPFTMTLSGENTVMLNDLWVGEVWICGGQSNMERQLGPRPPQKPIDGWEEEVRTANYPQIRQFLVPRVIPASGAQPHIQSNWVTCSPQTAGEFSAVGYFFGRDLHRKLNVPIGLIACNWGGTPAEAWTSREALEAIPELREMVENFDKARAEYPTKLAAYPENEPALRMEYEAAVAKAKQEGTRPPNPPSPPKDPASSQLSPTVLRDAMLAPIQPYGIRGVIWYQGEANSGKGLQYRTLFPATIADWRKTWGQGDFPFLFVQLAPYKTNSPELREAQFMTSRTVPNTAMVVTTDVGDAEDIHPARKGPVGSRLALAARAVAYGEKVEFSGPAFRSATFSDGRASLQFDHVDGGLVAKDGPLKGFVIAGSDQQFVPAQAEIQGDTVVVSSESVREPVAVRYGWATVPEVNLFNREGLPASPFRTDDWR